jgi:hypothetical protein
MTTYLGKRMNTLSVGEDDQQQFLVKHAAVVIHGGFMDRVLGEHLDKRIPHNKLPKLHCPMVDTTPIPDSKDEQMFAIIQELVEQPMSVDVKSLIKRLQDLGATVVQL